MTRCAICHEEWNEETGVLVGHPVEVHVCGECFEDEVEPILHGHDFPSARPTDGPCFASWLAGDLRVGVPIPKKRNPLC